MRDVRSPSGKPLPPPGGPHVNDSIEKTLATSCARKLLGSKLDKTKQRIAAVFISLFIAFLTYLLDALFVLVQFIANIQALAEFSKEVLILFM